MTDRVYYPNAKPKATTTPHQPRPQPTKPTPTRHPYRPTPTYLSPRNRRFTRRRCCFLCCCWSILFLIFILLLSSITATAFYYLYNPKPPTFSISSLKISHFNLTTLQPDDSTLLTTKLNLTLSSKNPNKKINFFYDPIAITSYTNQQTLLANGTFPAFASFENNVTIIHTTLAMINQVLDADSANALKLDMKRKTGVPIKLVLQTKVKVKMDNVNVRKFEVVVTCEGIHGVMPKGKIAGTATTTKAKCKVDPKFKIWKLSF